MLRMHSRELTCRLTTKFLAKLSLVFQVLHINNFRAKTQERQKVEGRKDHKVSVGFAQLTDPL